MADVVIEHLNLARNVTGKVKPVHLQVPSLQFRVDLPSDRNIREAWSRDPLLRAKMTEAAGEVYESIERQMTVATKGWDAKVEQVKGDAKARQKAVQDYQKLFADQVDLAVKAAQRKTELVWADLSRTKKDYAKYKWKAGVKVSLGVASLVTTTAIMASSAATFGATAIPGILGMMRTASQLAQQCKALWDELETTIKQLNGTLKTVQANYDKASKARVGAAETAAAVMAKVLTIELPSIRKCQDLLGRGRSKLDGVVVKSHDVAKKLESALKQLDALEKKADGRSRQKIEAIGTRVQMMIVSIQAEVKRAEDGRRQLDGSEKVVKGLAARQPAFLQHLDKALLVIDAGAGASGWTDVVQNASYIVADLAVDKIFERV